MNNRAGCRLVRSVQTDFTTREDSGELRIDGYFAVFNSNYDIWPGASESVAPGAFDHTLGDDVRALIDHETMYVLGRNKAGTLELRQDAHGLWGSVLINPNDQDAMNLYARVQRGDVDQCSFGFDILKESEVHENGNVHWTIEKVKLYEVSCCTFPAYAETSIQARKDDYKSIIERDRQMWRSGLRDRLTEVK